MAANLSARVRTRIHLLLNLLVVLSMFLSPVMVAMAQTMPSGGQLPDDDRAFALQQEEPTSTPTAPTVTTTATVSSTVTITPTTVLTATLPPISTATFTPTLPLTPTVTATPPPNRYDSSHADGRSDGLAHCDCSPPAAFPYRYSDPNPDTHADRCPYPDANRHPNACATGYSASGASTVVQQTRDARDLPAGRGSDLYPGSE